MSPRINSVQYQSPYLLIITFTNKEVKEFDFKPYLEYPVYQALKDESYCKKAKVFNGTVTWDEFIDLIPTLYIWKADLLLQSDYPN